MPDKEEISIFGNRPKIRISANVSTGRCGGKKKNSMKIFLLLNKILMQ